VQPGILSKKDRIRVYKRALTTYLVNLDNDISNKNMYCDGMCKHINNAVYDLGFDGVYRACVAKAWPEYHSFKPKTGWKTDTRFWWSLNISKKCHMRRVAVLTALAKGKSNGE
jgi:hypothetical protein